VALIRPEAPPPGLSGNKKGRVETAPTHRVLTSASTSAIKSISAMRRCEQRIQRASARPVGEFYLKCVRNKSQLENFPKDCRPSSRAWAWEAG